MVGVGLCRADDCGADEYFLTRELHHIGLIVRERGSARKDQRAKQRGKPDPKH